MTVRIQSEPFDAGQELSRFTTQTGNVGAVVTFTGIVRSDGDNPVTKLMIEHYPAMTERAVALMVDAARERWSVTDCLVIHRFGELHIGEEIMMVAVSSAHRADSFEAAQFLMDYLKSRAPFWKKEFRTGTAAWVDGKLEDENALRQWDSEL
ncbi:MAG: molybdenum cofactor biosynthesis protein MoaE [Rhodobacteraceae bacterium]|nr:molybdenum cofactor biosynthesis protein MoaE [Paracoccaceae bacterium]MCY4196501.1 molybdenum cofactor biosynthesis protein MoaE [Paracoccaceae bacterium]MCY4327629.1 molybdenum cofactor biosynthesis protein MoaE [Paracoccaceae bacterium]